MGTAIRHRRSFVLALLVTAMTVALAVAPHATGTAEAGPNWGEGRCVKGYNYADDAAGYLFASSEAFSYCNYVKVQIWNEGSVTNYGGWPGFEGRRCEGSTLWKQQFAYGYVSTSIDVDASNWIHPCSFHYAEDEIDGWEFSQGALYFMCTHIGCTQ